MSPERFLYGFRLYSAILATPDYLKNLFLVHILNLVKSVSVWLSTYQILAKYLA